MIVSNETENIKKKINNNDKKLSYIPKSMWQFAKEENTTIQTPIKKPSHKPMSMWQMAEQETVNASPAEKIKRNIKALKEKRNGKPFPRNDIQLDKFTVKKVIHDEPEQITEPCEIIDVPDDEPVADFYEFGNHKNQRYQHHPLYMMDGNDWKKYTRTLRNKAISQGIIDFANIYGFQSIFFTITCDKNKKSIGMSKVEISQKFQNIQKNLKKQGIVSFGMKSIETHKSGLYHSHIILFVPCKDIKKSLDIIKIYVNQITNIDGRNIQKIYKHTEMNVIRYITKYHINNDDKNKSSSITLHSDFSFFGLPKGIISDYEKIYKADDSNEIKNHLINKRHKKVLELLGCFKNIKKSLSGNYQNRLKEVVKLMKNRNYLYCCQFLKTQGNCKAGNKWIYINKYVSGYFEVKNRGPPIPTIYTFSPFCQQYRRTNIMLSIKNTHYKTYYGFISGIPPPYMA
ncbi:replication endonuclease [Komagataeibacter diospyri]|uniref:Replication-associated protein ORF2/G2P domain-containing protein n=1 Tax=Komagataeibacter diospyri TaxID=1932662 RepID=A0A4V0WM75_9PROT|nr:replication endonuclease [Komagataeibacter diospyri]GCE82692.1 hypothetical protein MSKU9_0833 [Komagataeibacter diospyri]